MHNWALNKNGEIDLNYLNYETHNGPFCTVCRKFFCILCDKIDTLSCKKDLLEWSPIGGELSNKIINRKGHND